MVRDQADLALAVAELRASAALMSGDDILVQEFMPGMIEHAQAVYCRGRLTAMTCLSAS